MLIREPFRATVFTPINLILLTLFTFLAYYRLFSRSSTTQAINAQPPPKPVVYRTFTPVTLLPYNGTQGKPVYLAVQSRVYDVTPGRQFYGPSGPYANFAGRDASRGLACGSFDEDMLTENLHGPLDDLKDLGDEEMEALRGWDEMFRGKYIEVGKLVAEGSEEAKWEAEKEREREATRSRKLKEG